jgi:arylsulfatase A-like enzyme
MGLVARPWFIAAVLTLGIPTSCQADLSRQEPVGGTDGTTPPSIVVVVVDDLRWDEFGAAGHPYLETPSIDRRLPYEESIRNPLLVRYPPLAEAGTAVDELTLSIDIAPTVLEVAGAPVGPHIQGRSLRPLLGGEVTDWRHSLLVEFSSYEYPMPWLMDMDYRAVRTAQHEYIRWL